MHFLTFTWNPSEGIDLGFFTIRYYSLMFVIAFTLGWFILKKFFKNDNEPLEKLDSLFIYMVVATLLGARLGHVVFYQTELIWQDPISVILPVRTVPEFEYTGFQGLASHGAAIGIVIAMFIFSKRVLKKPVLWIFDRIVIAVAIGGAFVRFGNFLNSEIVGKPSGDHPLGVRLVRNDIRAGEAIQLTGSKDADKAYHAIVNDPQFIDVLTSVPFRHPTQLYEALGYIITFLVCWFIYWKTGKRHWLGYIFGVFLTLLFSTRVIVEFLKEAQVDERANWALNTGQWLSVPFIVFGLYLLATARKKKYPA
ncbi:MAG: prolipoprotein diacylglyceryl transferase [Marinirhabdus sp.]